MPNYKRFYIDNHYVFLTAVTYNRKNILIENIDLLRECFNETLKTYDFEIFGAVILPNHFHIIIKPNKIDDFSKIIGSIKKRFSYSLNPKFIDNNVSNSRIKRSEKGVWQRRFYEHVIRNEEDLNKHLDYIHYNPVKHNYTCNVCDWEFSSFNKFVKSNFYDKNWGCNPEEIKYLNLLDYE